MKVFYTFISFSLIGILLCKPDYYWRDYDGGVPEDAVLAYKNGSVEGYIGNIAASNDGLYVGEVLGGKSDIAIYIADSTNSTILYQDINVKILCTGHPENFEWVYVDYYTVDNMPVNAVVGGYSAGGVHKLYIGRPNDTIAEAVGNIFSYDYNTFGFDVLFYVHHKEFVHSANRFEVLVYNDPLNSTNIDKDSTL